jgi:hypothetical protein
MISDSIGYFYLFVVRIKMVEISQFSQNKTGIEEYYTLIKMIFHKTSHMINWDNYTSDKIEK